MDITSVVLLSTTDIGVAMAVYVGSGQIRPGPGWARGWGLAEGGVPESFAAVSAGLTGVHRKGRA